MAEINYTDASEAIIIVVIGIPKKNSISVFIMHVPIRNQFDLRHFQLEHKRGHNSSHTHTQAHPHLCVAEFHPPPRVKPIFKPPLWAAPVRVQFSNMEQTSVMERI